MAINGTVQRQGNIKAAKRLLALRLLLSDSHQVPTVGAHVYSGFSAARYKLSCWIVGTAARRLFAVGSSGGSYEVQYKISHGIRWRIHKLKNAACVQCYRSCVTIVSLVLSL